MSKESQPFSTMMGMASEETLKAVLRAILLDQEAYNQSIEVGGRVKEPFLFLPNFCVRWR